MDDKNVQYPSRYKEKSTGQVYDLEPMPGTVIKEGSAYNKANVLPDRTCDAFRLSNTAEPRDAFLKSASAFRGTAVSVKNIAWVLSQMEIMGKVQDHSHIFYDVFYPSHTPKIGYVDNRYITVDGALAVGTTSIGADRLNITNYPVNERYANPDWQEFTVSDGTKEEIIYAKETPVFDSRVGAFPATIKVSETGTYRVTLMGGKGKAAFGGGGEGGKGGTVIVELPLAANDTLTFERIEGSGRGMRLKNNGEVIAVAGGGGSNGYVFMHNGSSATKGNGGDGGTDNPDGGSCQGSGLGAVKDKGGPGGTEGVTGNAGKDAPDGRGGEGLVAPRPNGFGAGIGGGGFAGGGSGAGFTYDSSGFTVYGAGGGGSSFVKAGLTIIENSKGTNSGEEYALISKTTMLLKLPLKNSYTNALIYRSNLSIDATTHKATFKKINGLNRSTQQVRLIIRDYLEYIDFAVWLMARNVKCIDAHISSGQNIAVDESNYSAVPIYESPTTPKEIHIDGDNKLIRCRHVAVTLTLDVSDTSEILQLYGGIA